MNEERIEVLPSTFAKIRFLGKEFIFEDFSKEEFKKLREWAGEVYSDNGL